MLQKYVLHKGKKLKYGFTTGSAAAAATKVACLLLSNKEAKNSITIKTPNNESLTIKVHTTYVYKNDYATASVIKDGGDDADVTSGLEICAKVTRKDEPGLLIKGGEGVGIVTKKGLPIEVGKSAINPVPLMMIEQSVKEVFNTSKHGFIVEIFVPKGKEIAKKTLNYKLGIEDGISILGSTGIVKPMSEEAFKDSLAVELKAMTIQQKEEDIVFTFGNFGQSFATKNLGFSKSNIIIISNFVGFMLERACEFGIKKIYFVGNIGKIVKVAGGIFHTHSRVSDARLEIMAANALEGGEDIEVVREVLTANTTEEAVELIKSPEPFNIMAKKVQEKCEAHVRRSGYELEVAVLIYSNKYSELSRTNNFKVED